MSLQGGKKWNSLLANITALYSSVALQAVVGAIRGSLLSS